MDGGCLGRLRNGCQTDPNAGNTGSLRSFRGGSWNNTGTGLSLATRNRSSSNDRIGDLGFRVGFQQISEPPTDLNSTANLTIFTRTNPVGTIVGEFNATDPDGDAITYSLCGRRR